MSNFEIHELTEKAINRNSNIVHDTLENGSYATGKNLAGAVADLASANVAALYDTTVTYAIGQYCLYEGDIYRCIAITTGAFDSTAWTQIVVTGEFRRVVELTSAQYTALSSAEKNNGTLYVITDEETTAADIPYSQGVSVADKLDNVPTFDTLTTSDNNKLLGVSVSGSDISVGAAESITRFTTNTIDNNYVDLSSYSSSGNAYTFPKDGYLYIENNEQYQGRAMLNGLIRIGTFSNVPNSTSGTATYVRKGMTVYTINTCYIIRFYPLVY